MTNISVSNIWDKQNFIFPVEKVTEEVILSEVIGQSEENFDFCMCNPPFFSDHLESQAVSTSRSMERPEPKSICTAGPSENIAYGGEVAFIKKMIHDSLTLKHRIRYATNMPEAVKYGI